MTDGSQSATRGSENGNVDVSHQPGNSTRFTVGLCMPALDTDSTAINCPTLKSLMECREDRCIGHRVEACHPDARTI